MYFDQIVGGPEFASRLDGLSERVARIERQLAPKAEPKHMLADRSQYLASRCDQLRDQLEVSQNRTLKVLELLKIERRRGETRRDAIRNLENSQKGLRQRVERIAETNKILLERKQEAEREKERLSNEVTRQEGRSPSLLEEIRQRNATIQNQRHALADLNKAHDEALDDLKVLRARLVNLRGQARQGEAAANAEFIAPALKEMVGGFTAEELYDELKKTQEELHEAKTSQDFWRSRTYELEEKLKAAEEHATEAEGTLDRARRFAESSPLSAHTKFAYIRKLLRP